MIHETIRRLKQYFSAENVLLVTTKKQYPSLKPYISGLKRKNILLEPEGKDTAAAICLAALTIEKRSGNATMVVLPADHIIKDSKLFFKNLATAQRIAESDSCLVTMGIKPKYASTGYGYIETGRRSGASYMVKRFIEKPEKSRAEKFYKKKAFFWNSGIFIWRVGSILAALKRHMPTLYYALKDAVRSENRKGYSIKLANEYSRLNPVSIDYGVMEPTAKNKGQQLFCVKAGFDWVDIGSWSSVEEIYDKDSSGNIVLSSSTLLDVKNSIVIGERGHRIGVIGVKDLIIVQTKSGTLVCNKDDAQEVKKLVKKFQ